MVGMHGKPYKKDRSQLVSGLAIGMILLLIAAAVIIPLSANTFFNTIADQWRKNHQISEQEGRYISDIYRHMGYGGFIHNFKNYVLRKDPGLRDEISDNLAFIEDAINQLEKVFARKTGPDAAAHLEALTRIRATLDDYIHNLEIADEAIRENWPPDVTDSLVRVDDSDAILALWTLREAWREQEIAAAKEFETLVREATRRLKSMLLFVPFLLLSGFAIVWFVRRLASEIHQRRMVQEELQRAEILIESISQLGHGVSIVDKDLNLVATNEKFYSLLEFPDDLATTGDSLAEFFRYNAERGEYGPGDPEEQVRERMDLARRFEPHLFERTRPDGTVIEVHGVALANGGMVTTYTDITDRKTAEAALTEKERELRSALDNMSDGIFVLDKDLNYIIFNDRFLEYIDPSPNLAAVGKPVAPVIREAIERGDYGPGDVEELLEERLAALRSPEPVIREMNWKNGERILEFRKAPITGGGAVIVVSDITERRKARLELENKEAQLSAALDSMSAGMMLIDKDNRLQLFNDAASELYQFPKSVLANGIKISALSRIRAERGDYGDGDPVELVRQRMTHYAEHTHRRYVDQIPGGRVLDVYQTPTADGGLVHVFHDITERTQTEERLRENEAQLTQNIIDLVETQDFLEKQSGELAELAEKYAEEKERAEASEKSKSEFLASMSHEIRTPMTGVLGLADILLNSDLPVIHRDTVRKIKSAGQSLLTIINDILDLSKLEADKLEIETIDFNIIDVVEDAVELVKPRAEKAGLYLSVDTARGMPRSLRGDPTRIRQVLINLVGNAVKFTHEGGITVRVRHENLEDGNFLIRIEVKDTGIGIAPDVRDTLFEDFPQADASSSRRYEGTGLGLSISKRLTQLMGGDIGVDSELGEGSTFWFTFNAEPASEEVSRDQAPTGEYEIRAVRPLDILIAEDNELNQLILRSVIEPLGHKLTFVASGIEAIAAVKGHDFEVVLMDVRMPEMNGTDATRAIRQMNGKYEKLPIVAVTADVMEENIKEYMASGMDAYATKPIDRMALLMTVNEVLGEEIHVTELVEHAPVPTPKPHDSPVLSADDTDESENETGSDTEVADDVSSFLDSLDAMANK